MPLIDFASRLQAAGLAWPALVVFIKSTLVLAIGWCLAAALPRASAASRHLILTATLCGALLLPIAAMSVPSWNVALLSPAPPPATVVHKTIGVTGDEDEMPRSTMAAAVTLARAAGVVRPEKLDTFSNAVTAIKESWEGFLLLGVAAAALLLLGRVGAGVAGVGMVAKSSAAVTNETALAELARASKQLGLKREVRLLQSDRITVPVVWGFSRPILLLPATASEWPADRLRVVLLHELAHVRRGDGITLLLTRVAVALFWYQPLAWLLERDARTACERACDDFVLGSGARPSEYADHLLAVAKTLPQVDIFRSVTLAMTRRSQLEGRLLSILEPHNSRSNYTGRAIGLSSLMAVLLTLPLAALQFVPASAAKPASSSFDVVATKLPPKTKKLDRTPRNSEEWYSRGQDLLHSGDYVEAIGAFSEAAARDYRRGDAMYNVACAYAQLDDSANAVKWLEDARRAGYDDVDHIAEDSDLDPIRETPQFQKFFASVGGEQASQHNRSREALDRFELLRHNSSRDGSAWFSVGLDLLGLRRLDESDYAFKQAIALQYKPQVAMYNLACVASRKRDVDSGLAWLQKSIAEGNEPGKKLDEDTDLMMLRDDPRFGQIRQMADDFSLSTWNWTDIFSREGRWEKQLAHFRDMTEKYPQFGRSWFNFGYASLQSGDAVASVNAFKRSLQLGYRAPVSMYNIACAYARAGQTTAAIDWLYKARAAGFQLEKYLDSDDDLESLRDDPRFQKLVEEVEAAKRADKGE